VTAKGEVGVRRGYNTCALLAQQGNNGKRFISQGRNKLGLKRSCWMHFLHAMKGGGVGRSRQLTCCRSCGLRGAVRKLFAGFDLRGVTRVFYDIHRRFTAGRRFVCIRWKALTRAQCRQCIGEGPVVCERDVWQPLGT
jgi:hypothetical protein